MRNRRKEGIEGKCEQCGKHSDQLQGHHIVPVFMARRNPVLTPHVIKDMANLQMLCPNCHKKADAQHKKWNNKDVGHASWSLFDKDPKEVEDAQGTQSVGNNRRKRGHSKKRSRWGRKGRK